MTAGPRMAGRYLKMPTVDTVQYAGLLPMGAVREAGRQGGGW